MNEDNKTTTIKITILFLQFCNFIKMFLSLVNTVKNLVLSPVNLNHKIKS